MTTLFSDQPPVLAGDVGATKTTLALFSVNTWPAPPLREITYRNSDFSQFDALLHAFLAETGARPEQACFGVAGPVLGRSVKMTNIDWQLNSDALRQDHGIKNVELFNDLVVTAMGAPTLPGKDLMTLNHGLAQPAGTVAVLAPGTGLGEAFIVKSGRQNFPCASEGGHSSFAPVNEDQVELLRHLRRTRQHVSVEDVCSGPAVPQLHDFFLERFPEPDQLRRARAEARDQTPVIIKAALDSLEGRGESCEAALRAVEMFVDILAAETANLSLKVLATGGVYIGGGMPPRILPFFRARRFMKFFCRGVYRELLAEIPIHVILEPKTALLGAASRAIQNHIFDTSEILSNIPTA